eukprot:CAMPEP_0119545644 /NCGR_PEP_ID=MMETSP1352-20130426/338_1 /TAXON_ID=265584 /ORGANISM="Stauroneis constricta, Strain CCMP1120" /LENGTH=779 /DNA_ID=CAMNT_0007590221 /DNA_START=735 /DNA_END=3074 /DNA_ORIENTATION=-
METSSRQNRRVTKYASSSDEDESGGEGTDFITDLVQQHSRRSTRTASKRKDGKKRNASKDAFMRTIAQEMLNSLLGEEEEADDEDDDNFIKHFKDRYEENKVWAKQRKKKGSKHSRHLRGASTRTDRRIHDDDDDRSGSRSRSESPSRSRSRSNSHSHSKSRSRSKRSEYDEVSDIDSDAGMSEHGHSRRSKRSTHRSRSHRSDHSSHGSHSRDSRSRQTDNSRTLVRRDSTGQATSGDSSGPSKHSATTATNKSTTTGGSGPALSINEIKQYVIDSIPAHLKDQIPEDAWEQIFAGGSKGSQQKQEEEDDEMNDDIESAVVDPRLGKVMRVEDVYDFDDDMSDITGLDYDFPRPTPLSCKRLSLDNNTRTSESTGTVPTETSTSVANSDRPRPSRSRHRNKLSAAPESPPTPPAGSGMKVSAADLSADIISVDLDSHKHSHATPAFTEPRRGIAAAAPMQPCSEDELDSQSGVEETEDVGRAESVGIAEPPNGAGALSKKKKKSTKKKSSSGKRGDDDSSSKSSKSSTPSKSAPRAPRRLRDAAVPAVIEEEPSRSNRMRGGLGAASPLLSHPSTDEEDELEPYTEETPEVTSRRQRTMSATHHQSIHRSKILAEAESEIAVPTPSQEGGRLVSFDSVEIRYYERIMSDNPAVTNGVGIGIGWNYYMDDFGTITVNDYELRKSQNKAPPVAALPGASRRPNIELLVPRQEREFMLRDLGYTQKEIAEMTRQVLKIKNNRKQTINNLNAAAMEEAVEKAKKKVKRLLSFGAKKNFVKKR